MDTKIFKAITKVTKALLIGIVLIGAAAVRAQTVPLSDLDALRYIASHPDLMQAFGPDATRGRSHYETFGLREGRRITFEPLPYIASHPDLIEAFGADADKGVRHYISWGFKEGRQTTFDPLRYIASYPDLIAAFGTDTNKATTHYIQWGYKEKRQTTFTEADALRYVASYADLIRAFGSDVTAGLRHYITSGFNEGRKIIFDALRYIASYVDLIAAFGDDIAAGARHYIDWGLKEGRSILFDASAYLSLNADIRNAFQGNTQLATRHFVTNGIGEARVISESIQLSRSSLSFDATAVGQGSKTETITLVNRSATSIVFTSVRLGGKDSDQFRQSTDCVRSTGLAPSASCSIILEFRPTKFGTRSAILYLLRSSAVAVNDPKVFMVGTGFGSLGTPTGDSELNPSSSAVDLLASRPGLESGLYWFDPDGPSGNAPFLTYADMATAGGGWMQVRRVAGVGGWYPFDDNLRGVAANNPAFSSEINALTHWSLKFDYFIDSNTEYLFASGDGAVWCVLRRGVLDFDGATTLTARSSPVLYSSGTSVTEGGKTNVLLRGALLEDPWIGCEGDHISNTQRMLYGEAGISDHRSLKNARNGVNVFIRPAQFHPRLRQVIVDIDAKKNATSDQSGTSFATGNSAIRVYLPAGDYELVPIGPLSADGAGAFIAIELCTCDINPRKFVHLYDYVTSENPNRTRVQRVQSFDWNDAGRALADAQKTKIALQRSGWVQFFVYDTNFVDNAGGASLLIRDARFPVLATSSPSLQFANVGESQRLTVQNAGGETLVITRISLAGANADLFAQSNDCLRSIAPGLTCPIDVRWTGSSALTATATLQIESNNRAGTAVVSLAGAISAPTKADIEFGSQRVNTSSATKSVVLNGPLTIGFIRAEELTTSIGPSGDGGLSTEFRVASHNCPTCEGPASACGNAGASLPAGASCSVNVEFRPTSAGDKVGRLSLRGPRGLTPGVGTVFKSFSLSGTGVQ
jgi:hypothetical protein